MPNNTKRYEADIIIGGQVDQSLARALNLSQAQLLKFQRSAADIAKLSRQVTNSGYGVEPKQFREAAKQASAFQSVLKNTLALAPAVGVGEILARGFDLAISKAQEFAGFVEDSVKKAADFQTNAAQLKIETGDDDKQLRELLDQLQWKANKSPFKLPELTEDIRQLLAMGFDQPGAMKQLHAEMNLAAATKKPKETYDEHLNEINLAFSKAVAQGHIMEKNLYMLENAGIKIRPWLEEKMGLEKGSLGDLTSDESLNAVRKAVKKGQLDASSLIKFAEDMTKDGGKYSDQAVAPMIRNFFGATSTFEDMVQQFQRALGDPLMKVITDIANRINDAFTWDKFKAVQAFSEKFSAQFESAFVPVLDRMSKAADWSKFGGDMEKLADSFIKFVNASGPALEWFAADMAQTADDIVRFGTVVTNIGTALEKTFGWIANPASIDQSRFDAFRFAENYRQGGYHTHSVIPEHADGGIFNSPSLGWIGEAGPEAVLPLDSFNDLVDQQKILTDAMKDLTSKIGAIPLDNGASAYGGASGGYGASVGGSYNGSLTETAYGYAGDSTPDWNSLHGIGDHNNHLVPYLSAALSPATARRLGVRHGQYFNFNGKTLRYDDTAPIDGRVDVYSPNHAPDEHHTHVHLTVNTFNAEGMEQTLRTHGHRIADEVAKQWRYHGQRKAVVA